MTPLAAYLLLFVAVGAGFILVHLVAGKLLRPDRPGAEKETIYECGEPTIGSAWVQFDLRYYVVALLFVIFDVEVAFFFPWAEVFGKANAVANLPEPSTAHDYNTAAAAVLDLAVRDGRGQAPHRSLGPRAPQMGGPARPDAADSRGLPLLVQGRGPGPAQPVGVGVGRAARRAGHGVPGPSRPRPKPWSLRWRRPPPSVPPLPPR